MRSLDHYPAEVELDRLLRATAPEVVFVGVEAMKTALELAGRIGERAPGTQIVAINHVCDPDPLLETMRAGMRKFSGLAFPIAGLTRGDTETGADSRAEAAVDRDDRRCPGVSAFAREWAGLLHRGAEHQYDAGTTARHEEALGGL